jgi:hypothetical protein
MKQDPELPPSHTSIWIVASKDERDLQTSAERLVEQKPRLESGYEWKPRANGYGYENDHPRASIIEAS